MEGDEVATVEDSDANRNQCDDCNHSDCDEEAVKLTVSMSAEQVRGVFAMGPSSL